MNARVDVACGIPNEIVEIGDVVVVVVVVVTDLRLLHCMGDDVFFSIVVVGKASVVFNRRPSKQTRNNKDQQTMHRLFLSRLATNRRR